MNVTPELLRVAAQELRNSADRLLNAKGIWTPEQMPTVRKLAAGYRRVAKHLMEEADQMREDQQ